MKDKLICKLKNREFILLSVLMMLVFAGIYLLYKAEVISHIPDYATHMGHEGEEQFIYYLNDQDVIEQEFASPRDFDMISLHFSDHDQRIKGKTLISVTEKSTGELVYYEERENSSIQYSDLVELDFENGGKADEPYILKLQFADMGDRGLGIFGFPALIDNSSATINGVPCEYIVAVGSHTYTNAFKVLVLLTVVLSAAILVISVVLVSQTNLKEEFLFLGIAAPVGIVFLMFLSVNTVHDGATHLAKVYHYSNVLLGHGDGDSYGAVFIRGDEAEAFEEIYQDNHRENNTSQIFWDTLVRFKDKDHFEEWIQSHEYRETSASSFLEYFPGVVGMTIGRVMQGSARFNILLTKIFFFTFYIFMVFLSIKKAPCFKTTIAFSALLPMGLYQATGITYDTVIISASYFIFSLFLKARENYLQNKDIVLLYIFSFILGCCKGGFYLVILLLFLMIPGEAAGGKNKKKFLPGSIVAGGAGMIVTSLKTYIDMLIKVFPGDVGQGMISNGNVSTVIGMVPKTETVAYGIGYAFRNIPGFMKMLASTLAQQTEYYIGSMVGYRMAWSDILVSWIVIIPFLILILMGTSASVGEQHGQKSISMTERGICLFLFLIEVVGFHLLMLIETPVGADIINGVQGRYFIAWIPVMGIMLYNGHRIYDRIGARRLYFFYAIAEVVYIYSFIKIFFGIG